MRVKIQFPDQNSIPLALLEQRAQKWIQDLQELQHEGFVSLPTSPHQHADYTLTLTPLNETLGPSQLTDREGHRLHLDFDNNQADYQRRILNKKSELLGRAIGLSKGFRQILDLSCGLAIDSIFLVRLGCTVLGLERNPLLYLLLQEALSLTHREDILQRFQIKLECATAFLEDEEHLQQKSFEVIYFDPMYTLPTRSPKSALPRQEMVLFRNLVGNDHDAGDVLHLALKRKKQQYVKRVVVKRSIKSPPLLPGAISQVTGKVARFDIY